VAETCRRVRHADFSLVTGVLPDRSAPGDDEASLIVVAGPSGERLEKISSTGDPAIQRVRATKQALDSLRKELLQAR